MSTTNATAKLTRITIAPLEYFTQGRANEVKNRLLASRWRRVLKGPLVAALQEVGDGTMEVYADHDMPEGPSRRFLVFSGSSVCLVQCSVTLAWSITPASVGQECAARKALHASVLQQPLAFFDGAETLLGGDAVWPVNLNYVFTYYVVESKALLAETVLNEAKILAQPSLVGMDDMLSTGTDGPVHQAAVSGEKIRTRLNAIPDIDFGEERQVFITWESMLCIEYANRTHTFADLLLALELRLQVTWNRCFSLSSYADSVFADRNAPRKSHIEEVYWDFAKTLYAAKEVAASTASARVNAIFQEMSRTAALHDQLDRLSGKLTLLSHFIQWKRDKVNGRYQKLISMLLLLAALGAALPAFFSVPVFRDPQVGDLVFEGAFVLGLLAITLGG